VSWAVGRVEQVQERVEVAFRAAARKAATTSRWRRRSWSRGAGACTRRRARLASIFAALGERPTIGAICANGTPRIWAARGIDGPIRPHATATVEPLDGGARSHVTFTLGFDGHGLGVPLLPLVRRQSRRRAPTSYRNLKKRLETGR
jgi:hypothetical protein